MRFAPGCFIRTRKLGIYFFLIGASDLAAQAPVSPPAPKSAAPVSFSKIPRVQRAPKLEEFLQNQPREAELTVNDFRQYQPGDGTPASESTTAYLSYDDTNLYVVFVCRDEAGQVRGHLSKREDISQDDAVGVLLDTFHDAHRAYFFATNPLGIQSDAIYTEGQGYDYSFDTLWNSAGGLTPDGFAVLFSIPFKSLRFSHAPEQTWGIALSRAILRKGEYDYWPKVTQRVEGLTQQFAPVGGLEHISPGRNIQLIPYGLLSRSRFLDQSDPANPAVRHVFEHRAGLDAKFVVKDALTFDVTLNPDFSQVESDDPQVTINQRFEVYFPERRPFFIENAGFFQTPINLFFSRRIADPEFGGRMTGKIGKWALGALVIDDREPGRGQPSGGPFDTRATDGVVRVAREFGNQSQVGVFLSSRNFADSSNRVGSLDARLKILPNWVLDLQAAHSWTRQNANLPQLCQSGGASLQGSAYSASLTHTGRKFFYISNYDDMSPGFCTELGFVPRVDIRRFDNFLGYFWRPEKSRVIAFGPTGTGLINWDHTGRLQDWEANLGFEADFTQQTTLTFSHGEAYELFQNLGFRRHGTAFFGTTEPYKWLAVHGRFSSGTSINFFPAGGLEPFLGNLKKASLGFTLWPVSRLRLDETYFYTRLGTREGATPPGFSPGQNIFNNHILRSKLNYQFTKELSLRLIVDYNATLANTDLLDLQANLGSFSGGPVAPAKKLTGDILLTYLVHPGTAIYLGYTESYANLRIDDSLSPPVGYRNSPTTSAGRLFFVKMSYLFRF